MARKNKSPAAGSIAVRGSSANGTRCRKTKRPDVEAIWDACCKAQDADASRKAQMDATLQSVALRLGFAKNENGRWAKQCSGCGGEVRLYTAPNGHVRASGSSPRCGAVPYLQRWLLDEGFQP